MTALLVTSAAWGQVSVVNITSCGPQTFSSSCTIPATGSGHLLAVAWKSEGGSGTGIVISSITDNVGNSYVEASAARSTDATHNAVLDIWYAKNIAAGATTLTITTSSSGIPGGAVIWEIAGADTIAPLDVAAGTNNQPANSIPAGASVSTSAAGDIVISAVNSQNGISGIDSTSSFTSDSLVDGAGWAHLLTTATGSYGAKWDQSSAGTYSSSTVSFKAAGSYSACDLNQDGTVNIVDIELATDMGLSTTNCTAPYGQCNDAFAEVVLASAMGGACSLPVLGVAPPTVTFGNVTLGTNATQTITLTGTGNASTTVSQATVSGPPFTMTGPSLPVTLAVGQTASFVVTFTPTSAGAASGNVAFVSSALTTTLNETLSGTGIAPIAHSAALTWTPSTSSNVASYNIYRIASSSSTAPATPYPSVGSMAATTCTPTLCAYTDTAVTAGQSYWYYAAAVDTSNNVSAPSNIVQAIIPTP